MLPAETHVLIIGAGPAGLTAAYQLRKAGVEVAVLEADPQVVGGISKTIERDGFRFDLGGHRFFSKSEEVERLWTEILPQDLLERERSSRIYYRGKFFAYPLEPLEAFWKLGMRESLTCALSYLRARIRPIREPRSLEDWVVNQFGRRLFGIFFKTYTEKVWGIDCRDISADWASQRIKGLSLVSAVLGKLRPKPRQRGQVIKTLLTTFRYPKRGPGMMWEACARKIEALGGSIGMGSRFISARWDAHSQRWSVTFTDARGATSGISAAHLISSAPLRELAQSLTPPVSAEALAAARSLRYRDFLTVALVVNERHQFSDNWIYIHSAAVKVGRIQNYKSWSPEMVPDPKFNCYGLEYFCFEGDGLWASSDDELVTLAKAELQTLGLAKGGDIVRGYVVRQKKAYPVYDENYRDRVAKVQLELDARFPTLHLVGRNGMHKYDNQDHAMMTAMLCARNILAGRKLYDLWSVNQDAEYHEAGEAPGASGASGERHVPIAMPKKAA